MNSTNVYSLAKELGIQRCSTIINKCREHNYLGIKTPMSRVSPGLAGQIREWFSHPNDFQNKTPKDFSFLGVTHHVNA